MQATDWQPFRFSEKRVIALTTYRSAGANRDGAALHFGFNRLTGCRRVPDPYRWLSEQLGLTAPILVPDQVHGDHIQLISRSQIEGAEDSAVRLGKADGLLTADCEVPLAILTADCVPLFYYAPEKQVVGLVHAGWRGTLAGIGAKMIDEMRQQYGVDPGKVEVWIGPSIGPCCYEVDQPVIKAFRERFPDCRQILLPGSRDDAHAQLDLWQANVELLIHAGVPRTSIHLSRLCTSCLDRLFFSHRRDKGETGRMLSLIIMTQKEEVAKSAKH